MTRAKREIDTELAALRRVCTALESLPTEAQARVLAFCSGRLSRDAENSLYAVSHRLQAEAVAAARAEGKEGGGT